jgi:hypothetical protein
VIPALLAAGLALAVTSCAAPTPSSVGVEMAADTSGSAAHGAVVLTLSGLVETELALSMAGLEATWSGRSELLSSSD